MSGFDFVFNVDLVSGFDFVSNVDLVSGIDLVYDEDCTVAGDFVIDDDDVKVDTGRAGSLFDVVILFLVSDLLSVVEDFITPIVECLAGDDLLNDNDDDVEGNVNGSEHSVKTTAAAA